MTPALRIFLCSTLILCAFPAAAQDMPVSARTPDSLEPRGLNTIGFTVLPEIEIVGKYDSNVLSSKNAENDFSTVIAPSLTAVKKFNGHTLNASINSEIERFSDLTDENRADIDAALNGNFDFNSAWSSSTSIGYSKTARSRDVPNRQSITEEPENIKKLRGSIGVTRHFNRLSLSLIGHARDISYDDGVSMLSGAPVIFRDDDRTETGATLRAAYKLPTEQHTAYLETRFENQDYKRRRFENGDFTGASGNNDRYGFMVGFTTDYKNLLTSDLAAGYTRAVYDDAALDDVDIFDIRADIAYLFTPKLELGLKAYRRINQDNDFRQGFKDTSLGLTADYELLHNIYLSGDASYALYDYIEDTREDNNYAAGFGLRYLHSPNLETNIGAHYSERDSNEADNSFDRTIFRVGVTGKI